MADNQINYKSLWEQLRMLFNLEVDNAKLLVTEKLTMLLTSITFYAVVGVITTCAVLFMTIGIAQLLLHSVAPYLTYLLVAAFYVLAIIVVLIFRRQFIINPIARFLSKVILDNPDMQDKEDDEQL